MPTSRRSFLRRGSAALAGLSIEGAASELTAGRTPRVGIVGGGLAGVSCAWLLDGVAEAVLFESRRVLGGHAHTIPVETASGPVQVDVGAQFFARGPHPTYARLLEILGLLAPDGQPSVSVQAEMTITVTEAERETPRFVSPSLKRLWPLFLPWNLSAVGAFVAFALEAKRFSQEGDWFTTVDQWLSSLPVGDVERERLLLPLLAAMVGCSIEAARHLSARGVLGFVGKALPLNLLNPFRYGISLIGLGGNLSRLARRSANLSVQLGSRVTAVHRLSRGGFRIETEAGGSADVDVVVFAAPPYATRRILPDIPELIGAERVLAGLEYFRSEIAIHRDPIYMPGNPSHWSAYNVHAEEGSAQASVWYGALLPPRDGRARAGLFKSWATLRSSPPNDELFRREFLHPLITPDFIRAQRRLARYQGRAGIWFAGSYTLEVDSQETALLSAVRIARELAPRAPNLLALVPGSSS